MAAPMGLEPTTFAAEWRRSILSLLSAQGPATHRQFLSYGAFVHELPIVPRYGFGFNALHPRNRLTVHSVQSVGSAMGNSVH